MEYSITASDIAERIGCNRQDVYSSASYGLLIQKEYDNVRKEFLRRCGK